MKLSILTTLYRSAAGVEEFYRRAAPSKPPEPSPATSVNDASLYNDPELALALQRRDPRAAVIDRSRENGPSPPLRDDPQSARKMEIHAGRAAQKLRGG